VDKPKVFLGSSSRQQALDVLGVVENGLKKVSQPIPWNRGFRHSSLTLIEQLFHRLDQIDFAVFVFNDDDKISNDKEKLAVTRDNVLFECGLFMGRLGRERTYVVLPKGLEMPDDLKGIVYAEYEPGADKNLHDSLAPSLRLIREEIVELGPLRSKVEKDIAALRSDLTNVEFLLMNFLTDAEKNHLRYLNDANHRFSYKPIDSFRDELYRLIRLGLVGRNPGHHGIRSVMNDKRQDNDLKEHLYITEKGKDFLQRLDSLQDQGNP
jgi:hypothetical protein